MAGLFGKIIDFGLKRTVVPFCSAVVAAAGNSERMQLVDKLFMEFGNTPVLAYSIGALQESPYIREIIVVTKEESIPAVAEMCKKYGLDKVTKILVGGETRMESVFIGTCAVSKKAKLIAVHDGARPFVTKEIIDETVRAAVLHNAAAPAIAITDTLKSVENGFIKSTLDRESTVRIQTPQVFRSEILKAALADAKTKKLSVTDECTAAENIGVYPYVTAGSPENIKLTVPEDVALAKAIIERRSAAK